MSNTVLPRTLISCSQLRAARALAGWTQADLGKAIGVNERQIRFWEKRIPTNIKARKAILEAFSKAGVELFSEPVIGVQLKK